MWGGARGSVPVAPRARLPQRSGTAHGLKPPARVAARVRGSQIALGGPRGAGEREREGGLNARLRWPEQAGGPPSVQGSLWDGGGRPVGGCFPGKVAGSLFAPVPWHGPARKPARPPALPQAVLFGTKSTLLPAGAKRRPAPGGAGRSGRRSSEAAALALREAGRDGKRGSGRSTSRVTRAPGSLQTSSE